MNGDEVFLIEPRQEDYENAVPKDPRNCVVACAIKRILAGLVSTVWVDREVIAFTDAETGTRYWWATPANVHAVAARFDRGESLKNFSFDLDLRRPLKTQPRGPVTSKAKAEKIGNVPRPRVSQPKPVRHPKRWYTKEEEEEFRKAGVR
jgi:hypothetical protein